MHPILEFALVTIPLLLIGGGVSVFFYHRIINEDADLAHVPAAAAGSLAVSLILLMVDDPLMETLIGTPAMGGVGGIVGCYLYDVWCEYV